MHKIKMILITLAIVVLSAISFECIAQGQVTSFNTDKSCVDDSDCGDDGYCVNGRCQRVKEKQGCVDDSDCGSGGYCVNGICHIRKGWW